MADNPDTRGRFLYDPDDKIEFLGQAAPDVNAVRAARERVRRQLGDAGFAMSDAEVDAIIAAAATPP